MSWWEGGEVPEGWKLCALGDVAKVVGGGTPKTSVAGNFTDVPGHPWITPADLTGYTDKYISGGRRFLTDQGLATSSAKYVPAGTVLFSSRAPIGYIAIASNPLTTNQGFRSFVPSGELDPHYLYHALRLLRPVAEQLASGTTFAEISGSNAARMPISYPSRDQQKAIAKALDGADKWTRGSAAHLRAARRLIKRFRQSVLAAACSGRLTADWREGNAVNGSAEILIERSRQLAAKVAPRRRNPEPWLEPELLNLPQSWKWAPLRELAAIRGGIQKQPKRTPRSNSYPYLRVANVLRGKLDLSEIHEFELFDGELETYRLRPGDLLVVEGNGSSTEIGRAAIWHGEIPDCVHQNHIIRARCFDMDPQFVEMFWNSPIGAREIASLAVTTAGLYSLSTKKIGAVPIPVPPLDEQQEIVRRANQLMALAESLNDRINSANGRVERSSQAILAKAFRGELIY